MAGIARPASSARSKSTRRRAPRNHAAVDRPIPGGLDSYLQVLDAQRSLFRSDLDLAPRSGSQELISIVELYRALGGGWTETP